MYKHKKLEFFKQTKDSQHPIAFSFNSIDSESDSIRVEHLITIEEASQVVEELTFLINRIRIEIGLEKDKAIELVILTCLQCDYVWYPRSSSPRKCPNCYSPDWNKEKKKEEAKLT